MFGQLPSGRRRTAVTGLVVLYAGLVVAVALFAADRARDRSAVPAADVRAAGARVPGATAAGPTLPASRSATSGPAPAPGAPPTSGPARRADGPPDSRPAVRTAPAPARTAKSRSRTARTPVAPRSADLARDRPVRVSSHTQDLDGAGITDGSTASYWESVPGFPQTVRVDLGSVTTVGRLRLALPPAADWNRRVQTIAVYGSRDGTSFTRLSRPAGYVFDAAKGNRATVTLPPGGRRYLELRFSANDGWGAAQLSDLRVHSS